MPKPKGKLPALGLLISSGPNKGSEESEGEEPGGSQSPEELAMKSFFRAFTKRDARAGTTALRHFIELIREDADEEDTEY